MSEIFSVKQYMINQLIRPIDRPFLHIDIHYELLGLLTQQIKFMAGVTSLQKGVYSSEAPGPTFHISSDPNGNLSPFICQDSYRVSIHISIAFTRKRPS
jgi:hypothetical protein